MSYNDEKYQFTQDWFDKYKPYFSAIIDAIKPSRILEIGSFEGRSTVFIAKQSLKWRPIEITTLDSWTGGQEHRGIDFAAVEARFDQNMANLNFEIQGLEHTKIKGLTKSELPKLLTQNQSYDLIYVDGSHEPKDVLFDLCIAYQLLAPKGVMVADDYKWSPLPPGQEDLLKMPKIAIDSFVTCHLREINLIEFPINQIYIQRR